MVEIVETVSKPNNVKTITCPMDTIFKTKKVFLIRVPDVLKNVKIVNTIPTIANAINRQEKKLRTMLSPIVEINEYDGFKNA